MILSAGLIAARFLHDAAALALFGGALFPLYVAADSIAPWLRRMWVVAALVALVSGAGWFVFTAASMAGDASAALSPSVLASVVQATDFGPLWIARLVLLTGVLVVCLARRSSHRTAWIVAALSGLALASLAGTGHARLPDGWGGAVHAAADAAHLLAAGVWLGALWPLGRAIGWPSRTRQATHEQVGDLLVRFSSIGIAAVVVLVATGILNSWFLVGTVGGLVSTSYGRMLLVKIGLFVAMAGVAAANRYWITPAFVSGRASADARWLVRIRRHVLLELLLGLAVIAVVAVLGVTQAAIES